MKSSGPIKNQMLETQSAQLEEMVAEAKIKAEDLQRVNQYKSEFLANMSHELRTPLNSVLILSRNLAENEENNLTPDQIESASVISESGTQLLTLINDILDLSKIEAGKLELLKETFPLDELLTYLRRIFSPQAEKKQLAFTIQVAPAMPETIISDRQRLTQVLSNLLSNAIKFTDSGEVSVRVGKEHDDLLLEVADSGIGIPVDKLDHIFGAFQQVDGTNTRKYGGSGLGLAISRRLIELLGGAIEVKSQPGKGSSFTVRLLNQFANSTQAGELEGKPQGPAVRQESSKQLAVANKQSSILVVEDDTRLLTVLGRMIKSLGFMPLCVESAELAMAAIARETPLGILLDLGLPQMNGMEMLRRLKADKATAQIPVYIMSAATDNGEARVLGALGFLTKPVTRDAIAAAIKMIVTTEQTFTVKRILLVDDNSADIESIQKLFKQDALEVVPVNTGGAALQKLQTHRFDTVILGLTLPDMTGLEWLKQACHLLNPPPVVVNSARVLSEEEVFKLKEFTESIVNKDVLNNRLRDEVLRAVQLDSNRCKIATTVNVSGSGKNLLVVDDDARNLFALTKVLRAKGFAIEVASDSAQALEVLKQNHFDAVLTDIMMPKMDGYELIRQIRALGYSDMPIVAITAKAMQGDDELCLQAGATAYLAKPVDMDKLLTLLKGV
jgi:CheY-like chemotaxis protein/nitrogen-specific signal transduction histidine kinase